MIVDFDVHHGNGTQEVFESDPDILYLSTHQWGIYPGSGEMRDTGRGRAAGNTINIPLPAGAGDQTFAAVTDRIILPAGKRFAPELIMVSAGFDAHWCDPLAGLQLSGAGFYRLACRLAELASATCQSRVVLSLEGGYDPSALAASIVAVLAGISGDAAPPDKIGPAPSAEPDVSEILANVAALHQLS
jgi:acetoin utilization deacetylase AcuC-like enzyme